MIGPILYPAASPGDSSALIAEAHQANGIEETTREQIQRDALLRNLTILERLECLDEATKWRLSALTVD
ncbi:hypothetical protein N8564_03265 [Verrucomicrobiales bacterium]|nr:hypothetical protein [Verrucomicrobiales bacterium]